MFQLKILSCLICLHGLIAPINGADKYTDENRPYEFGFSIDGEQHRHEKKDENGIIMGEFGFITADGVYHVTVYATDENGRFKILSMKNIRVKPYPTAGGGVKKGHSIPFPASENAPVLQGPSSTKTKSSQQESKPLQLNKQISSPAKSCSHCSLPTTTTRAPPPQLTDIAVVSKDRPLASTSGLVNANNYQQNTPLSNIDGQNRFGKTYPGEQSNSPSPGFAQNNAIYPKINSQQGSFGNVQQNYQDQGISRNQNSPSNTAYSNYPQQNNKEYPNQSYYQNEDNDSQRKPQVSSNTPQSISSNRNNGVNYNTQEESNLSHNNPQKEINADQYYPQQQTNRKQSGTSYIQPPPEQASIDNSQIPKDTFRNPKQYSSDIPTPSVATGRFEGFEAALASHNNQPVSNRPTLLAAQMQIVPKDTNIHHRNPGEEEGLPDGLSKDDMTHLLYTFNYTVGFHGHHEEGYSNGAKKGYYYVTGRNGVRTRIDYIADEKGFRPRISQEVLDLLSDDVPKPETEKDEKFGLKGYEFKWIYYPTN